jgi:hypothetical protein
MDRISPEEIRRAIDKYDKEDRSKSKEKYNPKEDFSEDTDQKKGKNKGKRKNEENNDYNFSPKNTSSLEFKQFEMENKTTVKTFYEKGCKFCGNLMKVSPGESQKENLKEALSMANLNLEPEDTFAFAIFGPLIYMFIGLGIALTLLNGDFFFVAFFLLSGIGGMVPLTRMPYIFANTERMKSSKEIVLSIFYIVTYMRQNSNLEKAIEFAGDHLAGPLGMDFKKVLWDIESEKYDTIVESIESYLKKWRKTNPEFIESMTLIESSLYESREENRIGLLDKALDVILSETYEKMLHYSHSIQSPISTLHMLGVILPILGLVIMPLVVVFLENIQWFHISVLYNLVIPIAVFYVGKTILSTRPGGAGSTEISEDNVIVQRKREGKKRKNPLLIGLFIAISLILIGFTPIFLHMYLGDGNDIVLFKKEWDEYSGIKVLEYRESKTVLDSTGEPKFIGPFGLISSLFGLFIIMGLGFGAGFYYKYKTQDLISIREDTKKLESEFGSAIFQLGNRLGDGIPLEMAFSKVVNVMRDTEPGIFFSIIDQNVRRLGMSPGEAIFDEKEGALLFFPSNIIRSTMKVLVESIKKGPLIAANAMTNVARYVKEMHSVEERLKDLLAEIISSMNSLVKFLAPIISGIVVGITAMITTIIGRLSGALSQFGEGAGDQAGALAGLTEMFSDGMPTYHFQIVVGVYIVQIVFIVAQTVSGIQNGDDKVGEQNTIGNYLIASTALYAITTAAVMIIFSTIAMSVLGNVITTDVM